MIGRRRAEAYVQIDGGEYGYPASVAVRNLKPKKTEGDESVAKGLAIHGPDGQDLFATQNGVVFEFDKEAGDWIPTDHHVTHLEEG